MQVHLGTGALRGEWPAAVACVGTFDGVHLGHQAVIRSAVTTAHAKDLPCVLVTFDRHPAAILAPSKNPTCLAPIQENLACFERLGVGVTLVLPFDANLSRMSAEHFLRKILIEGVHASEIVVGHDFAMGNGREGTPEWIAERIQTTVVPPFQISGERVSSSRIRIAVASGDMEVAEALLGRPYALAGVVVGGQKLGRELGYPTANLARSTNQAVPADGIYAGWFESARGRYAAAISIGVRPTVAGVGKTIESYLLDYPGESLYGMSARVEIAHRIRPEINFPSLADLVRQIDEDVAVVRRYLHGHFAS